jgi:hypothetical protein
MSTKLGGFGTAAGDGQFNGGRDYIDSANVLFAGKIVEVRIRINDVGTTGIKFKVFRLNGGNFDFIGVTALIPSASLIAGANTLNVFSTAITCAAGDYPALCLPGAGDPLFAVQSGSGSLYYKGGDILAGSTAVATFANVVQNVEFEFWGVRSGITAIKTLLGVAKASVKRVDQTAIASVKTIVGIP